MQRRNEACYCGSGKRFKHCHGADVPTNSNGDEVPTDEVLLATLKSIDEKNRLERMEPSARNLLNVGEALAKLGYNGEVVMGSGASPLVQRTQKLNDMLFVPKELRSGAVHVGAYLFKDMFTQLHAPIIFGAPRLDFWQMIDLNDVQKIWLSESQTDANRFIDQAIDILDLGYGCMEFGHGRDIDKRANNLIWRARTQLEASAVTAVRAYDFGGSVQSALLGTELALKAGLAAHGVNDSDLQAIGHNLGKLATRLAEFEADFDIDRVNHTIKKFPSYVLSRYQGANPDRETIGHIIMGAQYVGAEVTRRFSDRNLRLQDEQIQHRSYPT